jgi:hypothetical protein
MDLHVPIDFCEFLYAKRDAKAKTCECNIFFMPPWYGVHGALRKRWKCRKHFYGLF